MIALGTSQAIEGSATNASTVNYTIGGLLLNDASPPVATGYQILAQGQLGSSAGSMYNPGGSATALISYINFNNTGATAQSINLSNVMRDDVPRESLAVEQVLANAPDREDDLFKLRPVLE